MKPLLPFAVPSPLSLRIAAVPLAAVLALVAPGPDPAGAQSAEDLNP